MPIHRRRNEILTVAFDDAKDKASLQVRIVHELVKHGAGGEDGRSINVKLDRSCSGSPVTSMSFNLTTTAAAELAFALLNRQAPANCASEVVEPGRIE